ncbi:MAG: hypothetical protein H8M99_12790 [Gloeobacteraceae cyanobacterium ES-bin-144]|nr:hypothetical protein [Verrucomicrobiales bacterium]
MIHTTYAGPCFSGVLLLKTIDNADRLRNGLRYGLWLVKFTYDSDIQPS